MKFVSTRNTQVTLTLSEAIIAGLAADGGLFLPQEMPFLDFNDFSIDQPYDEFAYQVLSVFFEGDALAPSLKTICKNAFNFSVPLKKIDETTYALELFHGPTSSFKDFGARFLSECLTLIDHKEKTILVATSGDTGSAVASAFYEKPHCRVVILYPMGQVSKKQEHQMTCWGRNISAFSVKGTFDDCQSLVKQAFSDPACQHFGLSSANSINIGRLLPQLVYYAYNSILFYKNHKEKIGFIIPTGNLGNATAAYWAQAIGFPIREIVLATNANRVISDYLDAGYYQPKQSITTIANAMDVGNPSNLERLSALFPIFSDFKKHVKAISVSDHFIRMTIKDIYESYNYIICPHTATGFYARAQLDKKPWIVVATADPCKFDILIESVIHHSPPIAPQLQKLLDQPTQVISIEAKLSALKMFLFPSTSN